MENEETPNLNTEPNDIAGNRLDGPVGNTAAKPGRPGAGAGIPGGPPRADAESETSAAPPAAPATEPPAARAAAPGSPQPPAGPAEAYGGNFSNSTQGSYRDPDRRENQDSDPNRGEFGAQDPGGTTHGGFGNQERHATYVPRDSAEDQYYGGPGAPGPQDNAYSAYDGRDERPDGRSEYGFEPGAQPAGPAADVAPAPNAGHEGPNGDNRNQPDPARAHQNDNGSAPGPDRGYAPDYGHTSLPTPAAPAADPAQAGRRNQTEDYLPAQQGFDPQGRRAAPQPEAAAPGERPASSLGYGDRGREEPRRTPDFATGDDRNGYVQANGGDAAQGLGSRGGSYNDAYDDSKPDSPAGSPAQGDQRREDTDASYGAAARQQNRTAEDDDRADHGAPHRNAGREGEADE